MDGKYKALYENIRDMKLHEKYESDYDMVWLRKVKEIFGPLIKKGMTIEMAEDAVIKKYPKKKKTIAAIFSEAENYASMYMEKEEKQGDLDNLDMDEDPDEYEEREHDVRFAEDEMDRSEEKLSKLVKQISESARGEKKINEEQSLQDYNQMMIDIGREIGREPEIGGGGAMTFIFDLETGSTLTFGHVNGPLGYDVMSADGRSLIADEMDEETTDVKKQADWMKRVIDQLRVKEGKIKEKVVESRFSRYASTDEQEELIVGLEKTLKELDRPVVGATTIGKSPQTVILDLTYQGSEIYVNAEDEDYGRDAGVTINDIEISDVTDADEVARAIEPEDEE